MGHELPPSDDEIAVVRGIARFAMTPEWLILHPKATDKALRLYALLFRYADNDTKVAYPSRKRLSLQMRCSVDSIDRALAKLIELKAVTVKRRKSPEGDHTSNLYRLEHEPPKGYTPLTLKDVPEAPPKNESKVRGKGGGRTGAATQSRTGAATPSRTGAATGSRTGAALTRTSRNENQNEEGGRVTSRNAGASARTRTESPPTLKIFPTQCDRHQNDWNEEPCHGCRRAREAAEAAAATAPEVRCDDHGTKHRVTVECPSCVADRKAAS